MYTPNSIKVAVAIGHRQFGIWNNAMICLSGRLKNSFPVRNCPMPKATFVESVIYVHLVLYSFECHLILSVQALDPWQVLHLQSQGCH